MKGQSWDHAGCTVLINYVRMQLCLQKMMASAYKEPWVQGWGCVWLRGAGSPGFCPQHHISQVWPDKPVIPALEKWSRESTYNGREFQDKLDPMRPHLEWGREPEQPLVILVSTGTCPHKKFQTVTKNEGRKTTCPLSCPFCSPTSP